MAGLKDWVESKSNIPDNDDELFTVSTWSITPQKIDFKIFFTTKRLISFTARANHIAADETYKLTRLNFPLLMCGTTDKNRSYHPFGVMLSKHETHEEFAFMFDTVKKLSKDLYDQEFDVHILLADAAMAITNGFLSVFGYLDKRIVCWAHVERHVKDHLKGLNKEIKKKFYLMYLQFNDQQLLNISQQHCNCFTKNGPTQVQIRLHIRKLLMIFWNTSKINGSVNIHQVGTKTTRKVYLVRIMRLKGQIT